MKRICLLIAAFLAAGIAYAQTTIKVQAPNLVSSDEQFNVTFVIEGEHAPSSFEWECPDGFKVVWGPQKGTSTSISIINGKKTTSAQTTYTYVLMPTASGSFQIPAATAVVRGERVLSRGVPIEVVSSSSAATSPSSQSSASDSGRQASAAGQVSGQDIFMRFSISKTRAVVGETLVATLKLYQRVTIAGFEDARFPNFNGFWSQELQAPTNIEFRRENVGGEIFNSAVLRSWTLIPQQAGVIRIEPAELVCLVNVRAPRASTGSIFDSFFQDEYQTVRKRISTPAMDVSVSALPSGAPSSFGGGVGSFTMSASLTRDSLKAHDAASLKVTVSGKGNVSLLEAPKVKFPPDFEVYDTKVSETPSSKTFEFPFIPRSHGEFGIGPVEYSYYDVSAGKYVTLSSDVMPLSVSRGEGDDVSFGGQTVAAPAGRKDVRNLGSDIRYIAHDIPSFSGSGKLFVGSPAFWIILLFLFVLAAAFLMIARHLAAQRADTVGARGRAANKMARKRLAAAGEYLGRDLYTAFYEELHKALLGYVSDKLNIDMSGMSRENISSRLAEVSVPETVVNQFVGLIEACEFARYAPSSGHDAMSAHYDGAVNVISSIEQCMKGRKNISAALLLLLLLPAGLMSASEVSDSLWTAGVNAYERGDWPAASGNWNRILNLGFVSPELYYNIGNASFKERELAKAVLAYERALKLDPSYSDARYNLEQVEAMLQDRIDSVPEFFVKTFVRKLGFLMDSNAWAVLFLVLAAVVLGSFLLFLLGSAGRGRKAGFFSGILALLLALACLGFSISGKKALDSHDDAVVMSSVCTVRSAPGESSTDLFILHEGTRVRILDATAGWLNIELSDGRQGWMRDKDADRI